MGSLVAEEITEVSCQQVQREMHSPRSDLVNGVVKSSGLTLGQWDKALHRVVGVCKAIADLHVVHSVLFGD